MYLRTHLEYFIVKKLNLFNNIVFVGLCMSKLQIFILFGLLLKKITKVVIFFKY